MSSPPPEQDRLRRLRALPQPIPAAGTAAYLRERELALAADPEKRRNYERYQAARRGARPDYLPILLDVENVSRCNFRCTMCAVSDWPHGRRAGDLELEHFRQLIDEQRGLVEIKLQGIGEPLMQRGALFEMIRYARERHIWVRTTTNGSLLHLRDNHRELIDSGVNEVQISIDGADRETFEAIRRGSVFETVVSNCKLINDYCRDQNLSRTKMWVVVQQANAGQLAELVQLAARLGFDNLVFSLALSDWALQSWTERNGPIDVQSRLDPAVLESLVPMGERLGVRVAFWIVTEKYRAGSSETLCPWPFQRAYVSSDLRVVPCCYIGNPDVYEIGPRLDGGRGLSRVWNGDDYARFRQAHLSGDIPEVCRSCYQQSQAAPEEAR